MELNLQELAQQIHENAKAKGFYDNKNHKFFKYAQVFEIIKEVAEFHEAYKKGKDGSGDWELELPEEVGASAVFEACIKDTWQDELADVMIRLLDYSAFLGIAYPEENLFGEYTTPDYYELGFDCIDLTSDLIYFTNEKHEKDLGYFIIKVISFASPLNCNLEWHIRAKMAYNATRERLHGKKF